MPKVNESSQSKLDQRALLHLGYSFPQDFELCSEHFSGVRCVLLCGSNGRAGALAQQFSSKASKNLCRTDRYVMYRPTPQVLIVSHGIGHGSIDCLLHELYFILNDVCGVRRWFMLRIGSCGGVGAPPGTMVVTREALNGLLQNKLSVAILGKMQHFTGHLDKALSNQLLSFLKANRPPSTVMYGDTLCAQTFFDAQARMTAVHPTHSEAQQIEFLERCAGIGVANIEMESLPLAVFAKRVGVPTAVVSMSFVDRLESEMPSENTETISEYENVAVKSVTDFIKWKLGLLG